MKEEEAVECLEMHDRFLRDNWKPHPDYRVLEAIRIVTNATEKQIAKRPKLIVKKHGKHTWRKDKNGNVDEWAWESEYCNGVVCEVCYASYCVHCTPNYDDFQDCQERYRICPTCGATAFTRYCNECGQKLDQTEEREDEESADITNQKEMV